MPLTARALATLADVRSAQGVKAGEEVSADAERERLINQVSDEFLRKTGREFVLLEGANPQTRVFRSSDALRLGERDGTIRTWLPIGDAHDVTALAVDGVVYDVADVTFERDSSPLRTIRQLVFPDGVLSGLVGVTGSFGFEEIPEDVRGAVISTVAYRMARDVRRFTEAMTPADTVEGRPNFAYPRDAWETLLAYGSVSLGR